MLYSAFNGPLPQKKRRLCAGGAWFHNNAGYCLLILITSLWTSSMYFTI